MAASLFTLLDGNKDGSPRVKRRGPRSTRGTTRWDTAKGNALTLEQVFFGVGSAFPPASAQAAPPQNRVPRPEDVTAMMAALPDTAPVKPKQPRRVLVLAKSAGFVHSSIPLAARTIEEIGKKTGAWSTTITYDAADTTRPASSSTTRFSWRARPASSWTTPPTRRRPRHAARRCSSSCAAAKAWPVSMRRAIPTIAARRSRPAAAAALRFRSCRS